MNELVNFINTNHKFRPIEKAVYACYRVVQIQPFDNHDRQIGRYLYAFPVDLQFNDLLFY